MKTRFICTLICLSLLAGLSLQAVEFEKGGKYVTPQLGINSWAVPFGASFEYGVTDNIGVGGTLMMWFWSGASVFLPAVEAGYHFTSLGVDKLDLFGGAGLGMAIYNAGGGFSGTTGLYLYPFVAGRYYFTDNIGASLRVNIGIIGDWTGVQSMLGVVIRLGGK